MSPLAFLLLSIIWILSFYIKQKTKDLLMNLLANSISFLHQLKNPFIMFCGNYLTCMNRCLTFNFLLSWLFLLAWYLVILRSKFSHFQRFSITPSIWIMRQSFFKEYYCMYHLTFVHLSKIITNFEDKRNIVKNFFHFKTSIKIVEEYSLGLLLWLKESTLFKLDVPQSHGGIGYWYKATWGRRG